MTARELIGALASEVRLAVKDYRLSYDGGGEKSVTVYEQYIPSERFERDDTGEFHPLIVVALNGIEDREESEAAVGLTFAVYDEEATGWVDLMNLMETVRIRLLRRRMVSRRYRLREMDAELAEVQPRPFWYGLITARYFIYQPEEESVRNGRV